MSELTPATDTRVRRANAVLGGSMLFVAVRCTIQYVLLPFILPLLGLGDTISVALGATFGLLALAMITFNIIRLWNTDWRWRYLGMGTLMASLILIFLYFDLRTLIAIQG